MAALHHKVVDTLRRRFPDLGDGLDDIESTGRITGFVISGQFEGHADRERQRLLKESLRGGLSEDEFLMIGPIVTMTPAEAAFDVSVDDMPDWCIPVTRTEGLHRKVIDTLRRYYDDIQDGLDNVPRTGRVLGSVISAAFSRVDDDERQRRVWSHLEQALTPDELRLVGPIVTMTPAEAYIGVRMDR